MELKVFSLICGDEERRFKCQPEAINDLLLNLSQLLELDIRM